MPKPISRQDVTARAEQVLTQRRDAIGALADAQSSVEDLTATFARELEDLRSAQAARLKDAATQNTRAWTSALNAGWSEDELRQLGFTEPEVKTRARRTRKASSPNTSTGATSGAAPDATVGSTPSASSSASTDADAAGTSNPPSAAAPSSAALPA